MDESDRPHPINGADPKWRFFWRIGERPASGGFEALNAEPVVPAAFPRWRETMDTWGTLMLQAVTTCAEMAAVGFGLERDAIASLMHQGPHLLAPTGSDLSTHREVGTVLAGWHNDLNLFTIHGKSRYPGLFVWLADGTKMPVKIPDGCLLVQAGMQIERLTGGAVQAGMHEVVVLPSTVAAAERQAAKQRPQWRISSTLFAHVASAQTLRPLGKFATEQSLQAFPPITAGEQVTRR
jgi:isopenicillin N synthase-like dioxygenase